MEKTISITIASRSYILSESAYEKLEKYLNALKAHFKGVTDHDEIMKDIEARIAELLEPHAGAIPLTVIEEVISNMGTIEDFEHEEGKADVREENAQSDFVGKKFYRNTDDMLVAGVCSGLGAYFGVDATWVRLAFVVMTFMSGFGILFYFILWIITPEAKTTAQKLEMAGSPVTLETLSETVREKAREVKNTSEGTFRRFLSVPFKIVGGALQFVFRIVPRCLRVFSGIVLFCAGIGGLVFIMISSGFLLSGEARIGQAIPLSTILPGILLYWTLVALTVTVLVPVLLTFLAGISLLRKKNVISTALGFVFLGLWLIALLISGFGVSKGVQNYVNSVEKLTLSEVSQIDIPLEGMITKIDVRDAINLKIIGSASTTLSTTGRLSDVEVLRTRIENGTLIIEKNESVRPQGEAYCVFCLERMQPPTLTLTVPLSQLTAINARNNSSVQSDDTFRVENDFALNISNGSRASLTIEARKMVMNLDTNSSANLILKIDDLSATLTGGSRLTLDGEGEKADFTASHNSAIEAEDYIASVVSVDASHGSEVNVTAGKSLLMKAIHNSAILYAGEPTNVKETADEGSRVGRLYDQSL